MPTLQYLQSSFVEDLFEVCKSWGIYEHRRVTFHLDQKHTRKQQDESITLIIGGFTPIIDLMVGKSIQNRCFLNSLAGIVLIWEP